MPKSLPSAAAAILAAAILISGCRPKPTTTTVRPETGKPSVAADDQGIHFLGSGDDIVVAWGEIASVDAAQMQHGDGTSHLEVYVDHFSGVDFRFQDGQEGYDQVMAAMEQHLVGFSRVQAEAAPTWDKKKSGSIVWKRDERIQPIRLSPPTVDNREPTDAERRQMQSAHHASIATCERLLGRPLEASELECIHTDFKNGRIVGGISPPLSEKLVSRQAQIQAEILGRKAGK